MFSRPFSKLKAKLGGDVKRKSGRRKKASKLKEPVPITGRLEKPNQAALASESTLPKTSESTSSLGNFSVNTDSFVSNRGHKSMTGKDTAMDLPNLQEVSSCIETNTPIIPTDNRVVRHECPGKKPTSRVSNPDLLRRIDMPNEVSPSREEVGIYGRLSTVDNSVIKIKTPPLVNPSYFSGTEDIELFFEEYNRIAKMNWWNEQLKLRFLPFYLKNEALKYFENEFGTSEVNNWDLVQRKFIEHYTPSFCRQEILEKQMYNHIQAPTESVDKYYFDKLRMINRVNRDMDESKKVRLIIMGLVPEYLEKVILIGNNDSLEKLVFNIKKISSVSYLIDVQEKLKKFQRVQGSKEREPCDLSPPGWAKQTINPVKYESDLSKEIVRYSEKSDGEQPSPELVRKVIDLKQKIEELKNSVSQPINHYRNYDEPQKYVRPYEDSRNRFVSRGKQHQPEKAPISKSHLAVRSCGPIGSQEYQVSNARRTGSNFTKSPRIHKYKKMVQFGTYLSRKQVRPQEDQEILVINTVTESPSFVEVSIFGKTGPICIDTGACKSCVALNLVKEMQGNKIKWVDNCLKPKLISALGEKLKIIGKVVLPIIIGGVEFHAGLWVVEKLETPLLLGLDNLKTFKSKIDIETDTLQLTTENGRKATVKFMTLPKGFGRQRASVNGLYDKSLFDTSLKENGLETEYRRNEVLISKYSVPVSEQKPTSVIVQNKPKTSGSKAPQVSIFNLTTPVERPASLKFKTPEISKLNEGSEPEKKEVKFHSRDIRNNKFPRKVSDKRANSIFTKKEISKSMIVGDPVNCSCNICKQERIESAPVSFKSQQNLRREISRTNLGQSRILTVTHTADSTVEETGTGCLDATRSLIENIAKVSPSLDYVYKDKFLTILCKHKENLDMFASNLGGNARVEPVRLEIKADIPVRLPPYRVSLKERHLMKEVIEDFKKQGIVEESNSPYSSPCMLVKKKVDGKKVSRKDLTKDDVRLCVDYKAVNKSVISGMAYPMQHCEDIMMQLAKSKYYITIDLKNGFMQLPLAEESRHILAFSTPDELLQFRVLPFGTTIGPNIFQKVMKDVFRDFKPEDLLIYLDDLTIHAECMDSLIEKFERVMQRLQEVNLKINLKKCQFGYSEIDLLGHRICFEGIKTSPDKIKSIIDAKPPKSVKQVRQFLGLTGYYRKFCKDYVKLQGQLRTSLSWIILLSGTKNSSRPLKSLKSY